MKSRILPVGKLPADLLRNLLQQIQSEDPDLLLGPGIGLDCAVIQMGKKLLVLKSDPITFVSDRIGWYAVQVNANDIAVMGATPRWFLTTLLLPENETTETLAEKILTQVNDACQKMKINLVGGHTEVTSRLDRPILIGTMIGDTDMDRLVTPQGAQPGDDLLLSKHIPIEAVSILAGEYKNRLANHLSNEEINQASNYLDDPGISVLRDAQIATSEGEVHAMHDPTEGGISAALWEMAEASKQVFSIDADHIPISALWEPINTAFPRIQLDPMAAIASGALLLSVPPQDSRAICRALNRAGIQCTKIGQVDQPGSNQVIDDRYHVWSIKDGERTPLPLPDRDEIARLLENETKHA